jgi:hypothetical protein
MLGYEVEEKRSRLLCGPPNPGFCGAVAKIHVNNENLRSSPLVAPDTFGA